MIRFSLTDAADQQFAAISDDGRRCTIRVRYNTWSDRWSFDLSIDDVPVLTGRRVVAGVDLLAPFDFGVGIIFAVPYTPGALPGRKELPAGDVRVYLATAAEYEAA